MKPKKLYLDQLLPKTRNYTVRLKVIDKERAQQNPGKSKYQHLTLMDDKGNKIKAALFGEDVEVYSNIIEKNKKYDITNPLVKDVDANYRSAENEKKLYFTNRTMIEGVQDEASSSVQGSQYVAIDAIPRNAPKDERFDIVAVVLHVDSPKVITTKYCTAATVREIVVTDDSSEEAVIVTTWQDMAIGPCDTVACIACENPVIGFTALQRSTHNIFSLATTRSTEIELDPGGKRADTLRAWCQTNLASIKQRALNWGNVRSTSFPAKVTTVKEARAKKGLNTTEGELLRLNVRLMDFNKRDVRVSAGCSNCGKMSETQVGQSFMCDGCEKKSTCEERIYFKFNATDGTDTIELAAYTKTAEKLLQVTAKEFYAMNDEDRAISVEGAGLRLRQEPTQLIIHPLSHLLLKHGVVKWVLKNVICE